MLLLTFGSGRGSSVSIWLPCFIWFSSAIRATICRKSALSPTRPIARFATAFGARQIEIQHSLRQDQPASVMDKFPLIIPVGLGHRLEPLGREGQGAREVRSQGSVHARRCRADGIPGGGRLVRAAVLKSTGLRRTRNRGRSDLPRMRSPPAHAFAARGSVRSPLPRQQNDQTMPPSHWPAQRLE